MASAAVSRAMNLGEQQSLHPFFAKPRDTALSEPKEDKNAQETTPNPENGEITRTSTEPRRRGRPLGSRTNQSKRKPGAPVSGESAKQLSLVQLSQDGQRPVGQVVDTQSVNETTSLDEDPNIGRSKRQKTTSPDSIPGTMPTAIAEPEASAANSSSQNKQTIGQSWHEKLQKASNHTGGMVPVEKSSPGPKLFGPPSGELLMVPGTPPIKATAADTTAMVIPASSPPASPHTIPTGLMNNTQSLINDADGNQPTNPTPRRSTRPKKMLRLNANGRFSSPVSTKPVDIPDDDNEDNNKTRGRPKRGPKQPEQLVVAIAYGKSEKEKQSIAQKIDQILAGTLRVSSKQNTKSNTLPKKSTKPAGPPKGTHPFFLGKATRQPESETATSKSVTSDASHSACHEPTRRETACTPGKLRAQARSAQSQHEVPKFASFGLPNIVKLPGSLHAPWPWKGIVRVGEAGRDMTACMTRAEELFTRPFPHGQRKLKGNAYRIARDDNLLDIFRRDLLALMDCSDTIDCFRSDTRSPHRLLTVGPDIQHRVQTQLISSLDPTSSPLASSQSSAHQRHQSHPSLTNLFHAIPQTLTPFDRGECETQSWTQKYAPKRAEDVLQSPKEISVLRSWLESLTVNVVETGSRESAKPPASVKAGSKKAPGGKPSKKKRKRAEELDDFIVSSEDESVMSVLTNLEDMPNSQSEDGTKRSLVNLQGACSGVNSSAGRLKNALLLSGPPGSGKTAAVFAVAKELGFEVFEINPGSRRSGKDVIYKIGDMTENHLVQRGDCEPQDQGQAQAVADEERLANAVRRDIESGKQASMNSFFVPMKKEVHPKPEAKASVPPSSEIDDAKPQVTYKPSQRSQRQSLILLEEVDVLFEEDKGFWMTVFSLAVQSRRPIIMTCNDEDLVPLDALDLHAILRLSPASPELAVDYLLLLAAHEGHLLDRSAVTDLYSSKKQDLRASIMDLDFWCQMAVGDRKGGLEWMFQRWPPCADVDASGQKLRVTSEQTYHSGLGFLSEDVVSDDAHCAFDRDHEKMLEVSEGWGLDITDYAPEVKINDSGKDLTPDSQLANLKALQDLENFTDASSGADMFCRVGVQYRNQNTMDASQPAITEKSKRDYIEGMHLLQVDPLIDHTALDTHISVRLHLAAQRSYGQFLPSYIPHSDFGARSRSLQPADMFRAALAQINGPSQHPSLTRYDFSAAFDPISDSPISALSTSSSQMMASSFDRNFSLVTVELAPYVRSIAAYDLRLEAERLKLGNLLSEGGKPGKRARTTRAARSALEGGKRAATRRERWFSNNLNLDLVLRTGGKEWAGMGGRGFSYAEEERDVLTETGSMKSE